MIIATAAMQVTCITCRRFSLRGSPLARHGFGLCAMIPRCTMQSATKPRECANHVPAEAGVAEKRRAWLAAAAAKVSAVSPSPQDDGPAAACQSATALSAAAHA